MRFLDSSVFLHAYLRKKGAVTPKEREIKRRAKEILSEIEAGEQVLTTVIHISEITNIIEARLGLEASLRLLARILSLKNIKVFEVDEDDYKKAIVIADRFYISLNDAIAYIKMRENNINEIYTFDKHFRNIPDIQVIP